MLHISFYKYVTYLCLFFVVSWWWHSRKRAKQFKGRGHDKSVRMFKTKYLQLYTYSVIYKKGLHQNL